MIEIFTRREMERIIGEEKFVLFYISRPACGVCGALKPKINNIAANIDGLQVYYLNLDNDESVAGQYSIFTIPGILVYVDGKEFIREARYISVDDINDQLTRLKSLM